MNAISSPRAHAADALVVFGATGDLAYKKIFPALYALCLRGVLTVPIIGVAASAWDDEQLRARARQSIEQLGHAVDPPAIDRLLTSLHYVSGDYQDAATFEALRSALNSTPDCERER